MEKRMRLRISLFAAVVFVAIVASSAQAQQVEGFIESWNTVSEAGTNPQLNVLVEGPLKGRLGWQSWTLTSGSWSEALVGLKFAPVKGVEVSGSLGLETHENSFRQGASVLLERGRVSLLSIHENGGSGYWYRYLGKYKVTDTFVIGVDSIRFAGTGPYLEYNFEKVILWTKYAIDTDKGIVAVRFKF